MLVSAGERLYAGSLTGSSAWSGPSFFHDGLQFMKVNHVVPAPVRPRDDTAVGGGHGLTEEIAVSRDALDVVDTNWLATEQRIAA